MASPTDDEASWSRTLAVSLVALLTVSLIVGAVVGAVAFGAAKLSGIGQSAGGPTLEPSLYIPSGRPSTSPEAYPDPPDAEEPSESAESSPSVEPSPSKPPRVITLQAPAPVVAPGERIDLTGVYPTGEGATLQVQRFEGAWTNFPVTASVTGGTFTTYVLTSRTGVNRFRVVDLATGKASNQVRVTIG